MTNLRAIVDSFALCTGLAIVFAAIGHGAPLIVFAIQRMLA
ncbi:hypothetical protein [Erythrobacter rubeus]|nr:hypothetical protein [Erythrobacter rubeus]